MIRRLSSALAFWAGLSLPGLAAADCGGPENACTLETGSYHLQLPETKIENPPVLLFLHGYGGNGGGVLRSGRTTAPALARGFAVLAPNALKRGGTGPRAWNFHPQITGGRNETAFLRAVLDDARARFGLNTEQVLFSGFSIGGSMVHYIACTTPEFATAYAPVGGAFWRPHPTGCTGPVRLLHTHGWADGTVPLEGRRVGSGFVQGDVFHSLSIWRQTNLCDQPRAREFSRTGPFMRRKWTECSADSALEFALFPGGHVVPKGWANMALDWFEALHPKETQ